MDSFTLALRSAGISLSDDPDTLLWAGGDATGTLSVKNLYTALLNQSSQGVDSSWFSQIWNWTIPLKIKLFLWLAGKEKILTWDMLRRRGWEGPNICLLCRRAPEDAHHLFIHCIFAREVWTYLLNHFSLPFTWRSDTLSDCFPFVDLPKIPSLLPGRPCLLAIMASAEQGDLRGSDSFPAECCVQCSDLLPLETAKGQTTHSQSSRF
jgi:hypothetical protein